MAKRALATLALISMTVAACAAARRGARTPGAPSYPPRAPGCKLAVFESATPLGIAGWDDLGVAEVGCHINTAYPQCFDRLRAEACRMGGDILYNVPRRPLRPHDQLMVFRGRVAHTKEKVPAEKEEPATPPPPPASTGPIEPLVAPPPAPVDAGAGGQ